MTKFTSPTAFGRAPKITNITTKQFIKPPMKTMLLKKAPGPAFNNKFPKSRYRGGGQGGAAPLPSGGGDYTGPLDIVSGAVLALGQRALSANKLGGDIYTIKSIADGSSQTFTADAVTGAVSVTAINTFLGASLGVWDGVVANGGSGYDSGSPSTFDVTVVGGTFTQAATINVTTDGGGVVIHVNSVTPGQYTVAPTNPAGTTGDNGVNHGTGLTINLSVGRGLVTTWMDQSANNNDATNESSPPLWDDSVINLMPGVVGSNGGSNLAMSSITFPNGAVTVFVVAGYDCEFEFNNNDDGSYIDIYCGREGTSPYIDMSDADGNEAGGNYALPLTDEIRLIDVAWEFGSASYKRNGVTISQDSSFDGGGPLGSMTCTSNVLALDTNDPITDRCVELIIYPSILSDPERLAIRENIAAYYGITLS